MPKSLLTTALIGGACFSLAACGLTGPLERPEPLIGEPEPVAEALVEPIIAAAEPEPIETGPKLNELGGEVPATVPVETIEESGLPPLEDGN